MSPLYRKIGAYAIRAEIGGGGMADVYVAEDERTGAKVALKVPRQDPDMRRAERDGALLQQHLAERDPRVARVYEIGEDDGVPFVAMEYIEGQDLAERIARGPLDPNEAIQIAAELCDLLATAQACTPSVNGRERCGIVHGDLKPRNILLENGGRVRVVDFGIAKALSETRRRTRNEFGSLPYSSPERVDTGNVDAHSDLWAVAVVLYEMVAARPPFTAETPRQLEELILARNHPAALPESCPRPLDAVLKKAFAPTLERRYPTASTFKGDLEAVLAGETPLAEREAGGLEVTRRTVDEATRRTMPAGGNGAGDDTRRTLSPPPATPPPGTPAPAAAAAAPQARSRRIDARIKLIGILIAIALAANEAFVMNAAGDLAARLPSYSRSDALTVWREYQSLNRRSLLRIGVFGLGGRTKNWLVAAADDLMADYLSQTPAIRERGWQQAAELLRRAAAISPRDSKVRARLRYCEGQLARIDAEARLERNAADARARFNDARRAFEEAAKLRKRWPDPYLGLGRVQTFGYADVEQTEDALRQAQRAGYRLGSREKALQADAYRLRAERLWRAAPGLPDEMRYLERIRADCMRALDLYDEVPAYGQVSRSIKRVHALLLQVEGRETELTQEPIDQGPIPDEAVDPADTTSEPQ